MLHDYASGEQRMLDTIAFCRKYLLDLANGQGSHTVVPIVGSGTSGTEATIGTFVPENGKLLIHTNGVYGDRLIEVARKIRTPMRVSAPRPTRRPPRSNSRRRCRPIPPSPMSWSCIARPRPASSTRSGRSPRSASDWARRC
jgi:hypothetical protein